MRYARRKVLKGLAAGAFGGLVASWAMGKFEEAWMGAGALMSNGQRKPSEQGEDAAMKAAAKVSKVVLRRDLSRQQKRKAGPFVHYAFGTAMGALYGAAAELAGVKCVAGLPCGAALFVGADEMALPALKLAEPPNKAPLSTPVYALSSHLAYGFTTELVPPMVRSAI